jgi:hypothetical protein
MQIQYCDGCNLRVDNTEAVSVGPKIFCRTCAESKANQPGATAIPASGVRRTSPGNLRKTPASGGNKLPQSGMRSSARTVTTQTRTSSAGSSGVNRGGHQAGGDNKTLVLGMAGVGVLMAAIGIFLMTRGKPHTPPRDDAKSEVVTKDDHKASGTNTSSGGTTQTVTNTALNNQDSPPKSGFIGSGGGSSGMEDFREGRAQRELDKIKQEKLPPLDAYKRYLKFLGSYRSTKAGKEAEGLMRSVEGIVGRSPDKVSGTVPGLNAARYEVQKEKYVLAKEPVDYSKPLEKYSIPNISFPNRGQLGATFKNEDFLVLQITGYVEAPRDGTYYFYTVSDDGSLLYIGDQLLVNNDGDHAMVEQGEAIPLKAGKHAIKVQYYQGKGEAGLIVGWNGPDIPRQTIPAGSFSCTK